MPDVYHGRATSRIECAQASANVAVIGMASLIYGIVRLVQWLADGT